MNGITKNSVMGAIRNAVSGEAACSTLCANPKTRPCRSKGTTRCRIVCSAASAYGMHQHERQQRHDQQHDR